MGNTEPAAKVNGSVGGVKVLIACQTELPWLVANDRLPVDPRVCGIAVA
jgi:hypothetical protein